MPDFQNLLRVLERKKPDEPTLFEFFLNPDLYRELAGADIAAMEPDFDFLGCGLVKINAFKNAGYDYVQANGCDMRFVTEAPESRESISLNAGHAITDHESFKSFQWPDPGSYDYSRLETVKEDLPAGMKLVVSGPGGVLENAISLVGFERLCMMLIDSPALAEKIFGEIGERLAGYYKICAGYDSVGALISNDDWGFKTQTMFSPEYMRKYVTGWHKKIAQICHQANKPVILHSCGNVGAVMDDIISDIGYDAKHSYEDAIEPVEDFYERFGDKIAVLGGIDLDYLCTASETQIRDRCLKMLERASKRGGYALGTGNSVPHYVPKEKYYAMIDVIRKTKPAV
ncbi:methylcobalamin:coenzyme M methyltransferase [Limihaloglobus sulfuriphilus]|uniref:Methylcobalamin:coenzyme M methyltransferase n=1 Tax=Limihaloglobus sulfuriphilus TaxID=1851148 RepID=A0A1Q2MH45_9BACT|nr:uroporphyrinogen decarboxylase family protein [Limihaloglobus sulfuriphilus]AQQ71627.1 methylcobalamin:coenzyme M methyltransferase [Limihaloglobus sulfuriphilus]